jgi:hypothetical protein
LAIVWVREQQKKKAECNFATTFMLILSLLRYDFAHFLFLASRTAYTRFFDGTDYTFTKRKKLDVIVFRSSSTYTRKVFILLFDYFPYKQKERKEHSFDYYSGGTGFANFFVVYCFTHKRRKKNLHTQ